MSIRNVFYKYTYLGMLNLTKKFVNLTAKFFIQQVQGTEINLVFSMFLRNTINNGSWMRLSMKD